MAGEGDCRMGTGHSLSQAGGGSDRIQGEGIEDAGRRDRGNGKLVARVWIDAGRRSWENATELW